MKEKIIFFCSECGQETTKWQGRCSGCGAWNTLVESTTVTGKQPRTATLNSAKPLGQQSRAVRLSEINIDAEQRVSTGMGELDRVLGGGAVAGSMVLIGGEPGIGKSTLLLQICGSLAKSGSVLYVSGEESLRQLKLRALRLGVGDIGGELSALAETNLESILEAVNNAEPQTLIIDSIQTIYRPDNTSAPGSVSQVKDCALVLMQLAKTRGITVFVVGHVNKEGSLAGPKVLEHMVDCVLSFEGDRSHIHRILRAEKNRFGSTNEIGVFEMTGDGLVEIPNPSELLLSGRPSGVPGSCVACVMEGTRPVLAEVQALVAPTAYGNPRRTAAGFDYNRAVLLLAVLERRAGIVLSNRDAYINVIGGLKIDEPAADLAAVLALASSVLDKPVGDRVAAFGEVGLSGELRGVTATGQRLAEIQRLGFDVCVVPSRGTAGLSVPDGLKLIRAKSIADALHNVL